MRKLSFMLAALLAVAGIYVMLWPVFTGHRLQSSATTAAQEFLTDRDVPEQHPELLTALREYNQRIHAEKQSGLVDPEACEAPAADLVAYGIEDEIIGVLEIPAMELTMPVYPGNHIHDRTASPCLYLQLRLCFQKSLSHCQLRYSFFSSLQNIHPQNPKSANNNCRQRDSRCSDETRCKVKIINPNRRGSHRHSEIRNEKWINA